MTFESNHNTMLPQISEWMGNRKLRKQFNRNTIPFQMYNMNRMLLLTSYRIFVEERQQLFPAKPLSKLTVFHKFTLTGKHAASFSQDGFDGTVVHNIQ